MWRVKIFLNTNKLYHILKTKKNFDLRDNIKLANEVQKYKYMYDKAYKQHLSSLSQKMSFTQTKLSFV